MFHRHNLRKDWPNRIWQDHTPDCVKVGCILLKPEETMWVSVNKHPRNSIPRKGLAPSRCQEFKNNLWSDTLKGNICSYSLDPHLAIKSLPLLLHNDGEYGISCVQAGETAAFNSLKQKVKVNSREGRCEIAKPSREMLFLSSINQANGWQCKTDRRGWQWG